MSLAGLVYRPGLADVRRQTRTAAVVIFCFFLTAGSAHAAATVVTSTGTVPSATGRGPQNHIIYAVNDAAWWAFYYDSTNGNMLKVRRSPDLTTWGAATTFTLTNNHNSEGRNLAVAYKSISGYDVLHINNSQEIAVANHRTYHVRATISGGAISIGTEAQNLVTATYSESNLVDGVNVVYDSNNKIMVLAGDMESAAGGVGNMCAMLSTNADTGASWTAGFPAAATRIASLTDTENSAFLANLGSGAVLAVIDDGAVHATFTNLSWSKYTGSWSAKANIFGSAITATDKNNWGAVAVTTSDAHVIARTGANTYNHYSFNGTAWSSKTAPPNQTSKDGAGLFLATDGVDMWLFIIDSDAANTVRYCKYIVSTNSWGSWTALETDSQTRNYISGYSNMSAQTIAVIWSQVNGGNYDYVVEGLVFPRRKVILYDK